MLHLSVSTAAPRPEEEEETDGPEPEDGPTDDPLMDEETTTEDEGESKKESVRSEIDAIRGSSPDETTTEKEETTTPDSDDDNEWEERIKTVIDFIKNSGDVMTSEEEIEERESVADKWTERLKWFDFLYSWFVQHPQKLGGYAYDGAKKAYQTLEDSDIL